MDSLGTKQIYDSIHSPLQSFPHQIIRMISAHFHLYLIPLHPYIG